MTDYFLNMLWLCVDDVFIENQLVAGGFRNHFGSGSCQDKFATVDQSLFRRVACRVPHFWNAWRVCAH